MENTDDQHSDAESFEVVDSESCEDEEDEVEDDDRQFDGVIVNQNDVVDPEQKQKKAETMLLVCSLLGLLCLIVTLIILAYADDEREKQDEIVSQLTFDKARLEQEVQSLRQVLHDHSRQDSLHKVIRIPWIILTDLKAFGGFAAALLAGYSILAALEIIENEGIRLVSERLGCLIRRKERPEYELVRLGKHLEGWVQFGLAGTFIESICVTRAFNKPELAEVFELIQKFNEIVKVNGKNVKCAKDVVLALDGCSEVLLKLRYIPGRTTARTMMTITADRQAVLFD